MSREWMEQMWEQTQLVVFPYFESFYQRYGNGLLSIPFRILEAPISIPMTIAGAAERGFHIPELASKLAFSAIFVVGTLGTYDIALDVGKKMITRKDCVRCNAWGTLRCNMCRGTGEVQFQVKDYDMISKPATAENVTDAIFSGQARLLHFPSALDIQHPLPSKKCPDCNGTGVVSCRVCSDRKINVQLDIIPQPMKALNVLKRIERPYEHIVDSMRDPKIASFWLLTLPQLMGGFEFDDDVKKKIWLSYEESMKYEEIRKLVAWRKPGWEHLQDALFSLNPVRAKNDPVIVRNIPYYKAKKALEAEVMKLDIPPRPVNWGADEQSLPPSSSWSLGLKDPNELTKMKNEQREMINEFLDVQWKKQWREQKLKELLEKKMKPYFQNAEAGVLAEPVIIGRQRKTEKRRWWWFF